MLLFLMVLLAAVATRLVWVQAVSAGHFAAAAKAQRLHDVKIAAQRGTIYDREGEPLASSIEARTIYANPSQVRDKAGTARILAHILGGEEADYLEKVSQDSGFVYIGHKVDLRKAKSLEGMKLAGIGFLEDSRRLYPSGQLACQVIGFVGTDDKGLDGLEKRYNKVLSGTKGTLLAECDTYGRPIPGGVVKSIDPVQGNDIVLTLDKDIQAFAQAELARAVKKWAAKQGTVIVMNPKTGEIYAMASTPYYDPNAFANANPRAFNNRPIIEAYEPGSTMKPILAAAAIEQKRFKPNSKFALPSTLKMGRYSIRESHPRPAVTWSLTQIIANSSNIGAAKVGLALGPSGLTKAFKRFGLGERSGVDYAGESPGWMPTAVNLQPLSIATASFGQGVMTTALQLTRAYGAIGNDGVMVTPHFLLSQPGAPTAKWPTRRVISTATAEATTQMLRQVVTDGTGGNAKVAGYTVAGKTGTAQVALPDGGGYAKGVYESSFIGYLPADNPEVVICVVLSAPRNAIYGGAVAAPTFASLGKFCMQHLNVTPSPAAKHSKAKKATTKASKKPAVKTGSKQGRTPRSSEESGSNGGVTEATEPAESH